MAVNGPALRVARYRFRATFGRRWSGYLALALLIGLVGGVAMGALAAGRRTQSSFPAFLTSTNPSDLTMSSYGLSGNSASTSYSASLTNEIAHLAQVKRVESWVGLIAAPLGPDGGPNLNALGQQNSVGSVDGLLFNQDHGTPIEGRMANPERADELVMPAVAAHLAGMHVGQVIPMGFYSTAQANLPDFGTAKVQPQIRMDMKLVGLVVFNDQVVQDDVDRFPTNVLFTPALTRRLLDTGSTIGTWYGLQLVHGNRDVPAVEQALVRLLPPGSIYYFRVTSLGKARVERAVKPEAIALGVFGVIAALAALAIAVQAISRQLWEGEEDLGVLRSFGASPGTTALDGLLGTLGAVVLGSLLACGVAVGLSPLAPLGPVRQVYPGRGISVDWAVLGVGLLVLVGGLGAIAVALAYRGAPHRVARKSSVTSARSSSVARAAASSGLPVPGVIGVRFALEPGRGRTAVPVRSALSGTALAVVMVVTTLTFGSGLHTLVSHPALYGWNWNYLLSPGPNTVPPQALALLGHDHDVAAWTGVNDVNVQIDGQNVPGLLGDTHPALAPPVLSGHAVDGENQIVVGAATLARLHKHIGDVVMAGYGTPKDAPLYIPPTPLVIVGTATLPAVARAGTLSDHTSMGTGAVLSTDILPTAFQQAIRNPDPNLNGPALVFVRLQTSVTPAAGRADMQRIADAANKALAADPASAANSVDVLPVQHPAEIVNYQSTGATPFVLASGLAAGAVVALGLTLTASVRRRRRDLALLKTLGFTPRQLAATVAWQASVAAAIGIVVGLPLGVAAGRWLWILFAHEIYVVPKPTVPSSVILVAAGAIVLANIVAALPGRIAARTPVALVLRAE